MKILQDQNVYSISVVKETIVKRFDITSDERKKLSKNKHPVFDSRIIHSLSQFRKDGLVTNQKKGNFKITKLGINKIKNV